MLAALTDPETWTALFKIAVINVVLSGDNALVIALACRRCRRATRSARSSSARRASSC